MRVLGVSMGVRLAITSVFGYAASFDYAGQDGRAGCKTALGWPMAMEGWRVC